MKLCTKVICVSVIIIILLISYTPGFSQTGENLRYGTIKGKVTDGDIKSPLPDANIILPGTQKGTSTDKDGNFTIKNVPAGSYTLQFSYVGYETLSKTDVIVKSNRITFIDTELKMSAITGEDIVISAGYFSKTEEQPVSSVSFSAEEIRRAPGSAGDVSRILMVLPGITKVNDQMNSLIVRGGSPMENSFFVDNIEIPNINHYPTQGSSGGPIGLLNVDFIKDVNFYSGGFSAAYGDRLSSVMDLTFREGNRDEYDLQLDLNFAGFGAVVEGPVFNKKGSVLFSGRRSFLDLLVNAIGTGVAPKYSDYQGKLVYDLSPKNKLTVLNILGVDYIGFDKEQAEDMGNPVFGDADIIENTFGMNLRTLWGQKGYSNTSVSHTATKRKIDYYEITSGNRLMLNKTLEQAFQIRNSNFYKINKSNQLEFGLDIKHKINDYDYSFADYTDILGNFVPALNVDDKTSAQKYGAFMNYKHKPAGRFSASAGVRADYFSYSGNLHISPRFSFSYKLTNRTGISGSTGIFYQNLPMIILSQKEKFKDLNDPVSNHYVLGINHLLTENTRLSIEVYDKEYKNFPMDPATPQLFLIDELFYRYGMFFNHENLISNGESRSRGVELILQKKLAKDFYGLISGAYFSSRYRDYDGVWRDRVFDNRYNFSVEGGYKPGNKWEFSMRWIYAGGVPYTPFDVSASTALNRGVFDNSRINAERYSDYHSLNIRADRRFNFSKTNLIAYFSIWNAYNRKNIAQYYWNEFENKEDVSYQWNMLPIFGLEYEF